MESYIINPLWFYWIGVVDGLNVLCYVVSSISAGSLLTLAIVFWVNDGNYEDDIKIRNAIRPWFMRLGIICLLTVLLAIFIPSKETLIQMELARHATYENASLFLKNIQEATKWIIEELKK